MRGFPALRGVALGTAHLTLPIEGAISELSYCLGNEKLREIEKSILALKQSEGEEPICAYIYDLSSLKEHVTQVVSTLTPQCKMYYAVKANSDQAILETLAPIVDGFEVASAGEIEKVKAVSDQPFLFGGPGKTNAELKEAVRQGVEFINVESLHEIMRLERIAQQLGKVVPILLRVNLREPLPSGKMQMAGVATQFGIDEVEVCQVIETTKTSLFLALQGFHFHSMSNNLDSDAHIEFIRLCIKKSLNWARQYRLPLSCINVGGGIGINYLEIDRQFAWNSFTDRLGQVLSNYENLPPIYFECGRYLVAACGYYAVEVLDIKKNHGQWFIIVRGGTHHFRLPAAWKHSHPFSVLHLEEESVFTPRTELREALVTVAGELCTPNDVLARDVLVDSVRIGDVLIFKYVGAYGWDISHHDFLSHPHPRQILL